MKSLTFCGFSIDGFDLSCGFRNPTYALLPHFSGPRQKETPTQKVGVCAIVDYLFVFAEPVNV